MNKSVQQHNPLHQLPRDDFAGRPCAAGGQFFGRAGRAVRLRQPAVVLRPVWLILLQLWLLSELVFQQRLLLGAVALSGGLILGRIWFPFFQKPRHLLLFFFMSVFVCLRLLVLLQPAARFAREQAGRRVSWRGVVEKRLQEPRRAQDQLAAVIRLPDGARLMARGPAHLLRTGTVLEADTLIERPRPQANPGGFDQAAWLARQGIFAVCRLPATAVRRVFAPPLPDYRQRISALRAEWVSRFGHQLPESEAALLAALLLGDTRFLSNWQQTAFRLAGMSHLTAVSGTHVGFFLLPLLGLQRCLRISRRSRLMQQGGLLIFLGCLTGWPVSVRRAVLMALIYRVARATRRDADPLNLLGATGVLMCLLQPLTVFSAGFRLGMLACLGLNLLAAPLGAGLCRALPGLPPRVIRMLAAGVAITLAVSPDLLLTRGEINLWTPLLNLPALALVELVVLLGVPLLGLMIFGPWLPFGLAQGAQAALLTAAAGPLKLLQRLADFGAVQTGGRLFLANLNGWLVLAALVGLMILLNRQVLLFRLRSISRHSARLLICLCILAGSLFPATVQGQGPEWVVWFFAVGQGDAALIRHRRGFTLLVDGGDRQSGWQHLLPAMQRLGIASIDLAVVTHGHRDHAAGVMELLAARRIRALALPAAARGRLDAGRTEQQPWCQDRGICHASPGDLLAAGDYPGDGGCHRADEDLMPQVLALAGRLACPVSYWAKHDTISLAGAAGRLRVLSPAVYVDRQQHALDPNEESILFELSLAGVSLTFMADCSESVEQTLIVDGLLKQSDVLKVAHHGSRRTTSPAFLAEVKPQLSVISVGANPYGHPAPDVLERLRQAGSQLVRTDRDGAVRITVWPGSQLAIHTWKGQATGGWQESRSTNKP